MITRFAVKGTRVCLVLSLLLSACTVVERWQPTPEPVRLKVVVAPYVDQAPIFIADREGYFAEQGLEVELVKMSRPSEAIPSLAAGQVDVISTVLTAGLLNATAAQAIKVVGGAYHVAPTGCAWQGVVARADLLKAGELSSPAQLRGRRVSVNPVGLGGYYVEKLLMTAGLTLDDVQIVGLSKPAEAEAFQNGSIDVAFTAEPWISRLAQAGHADLWIAAQEIIPDFQIGLILFGPTLLEQNPDAGRRFMVAYLEALQQWNEGKTERNLELVAEFTELDPELLMQICWPTARESGDINVQSILDFQAWAVGKGYLDSPVTEEQFWDPSFVEYANEGLGASSQ
jgi:NitT/TauT family transport system substrate-binding protein